VGFVGVHTWGFGDGVGVVATGYTPGQDLARRLVVRSDGASGYVIGTDGWLRPWALAGHALPPPIMASTIPYGPGQAADITADGRVSVVSSFGAAVPTGPVPCFVDEKWPGWPIVRSYASAP